MKSGFVIVVTLLDDLADCATGSSLASQPNRELITVLSC